MIIDTRSPLQIEKSTNFATPIIESEMLDDHKSYHEEITGEEAEKRLKKCCTHGYLTRYSKQRPTSSLGKDPYVLTVYRKAPNDEVIRHFPIIFEKGKEYRISDRPFKSLQEMLGHYEEHRIDPALKKIGRAVTEDEYEELIQQEVNGRQEAPGPVQPLENGLPQPNAPEDHEPMPQNQVYTCGG